MLSIHKNTSKSKRVASSRQTINLLPSHWEIHYFGKQYLTIKSENNRNVGKVPVVGTAPEEKEGRHRCF
jgi:hypothetical protein